MKVPKIKPCPCRGEHPRVYQSFDSFKIYCAHCGRSTKTYIWDGCEDNNQWESRVINDWNSKIMKKFKIYAGMGGSFGGASYQCTIEAKDEREAMNYAYQLAEEEYQSYEGYHGIMSWEECEEDLRESGIIDDDMTQNEIEDAVDAHYLDEIESWVEYYVKETTGEDEEEEE